jgi:hypothetical protein
VPATLSGVLALLRYVVECKERGDDIMGLCMSYRDDDYVEAQSVMHASLIAGLERLAA